MEKVKRLLLLLPMLIGSVVNAQVDQLTKPGIHAGLFRVQGTVGVGIATENRESRYYIWGDGEGLIDDHIGINGAVSYMAGSSKMNFAPQNDSNIGEMYIHSIFAGPNYHFISHKPIDVFVGFQPGVQGVFVKGGTLNLSGSETTFAQDFSVAPAASANFGVAYYASFFHVFLHSRYVLSKGTSFNNTANLSDIRLSFGLGLNIN